MGKPNRNALVLVLALCGAALADEEKKIEAADAGGVRFEVEAELPEGEEFSRKQKGEIAKILSKRLGAGFSRKVKIESKGDDGLLVTVSGKRGDFSKEEIAGFKEAITRRGEVSFHMAHPDYRERDLDPKKLPAGAHLLPVRLARDEKEKDRRQLLIQKEAAIDGSEIKRMWVTNEIGRWQIFLMFEKKGADIFFELSKKHNKRDNPDGLPVAIVVDGEVVSSPVFNEPIAGGSVQISGDFTEEEARGIVSRAKRPLLPLKILSTELLPAD